jgi:glyoxylase-like metal-dependent hydrolase (beta-lactamase superfamily II)
MADNLTRLSRLGFVNAYLVREDDGLTVVDTMLPGSAKAILGAAERVGAPIVRVALTHAHGDHIGSLDTLAEALPGVEVLISTRDARLLAKDMSLDPSEPDDKLRGGYPGARTKPTRTLEPGDMVGSLEVVASPGHTPGHVAFLDRRDGTLIAGDAYSTLGGVATAARANPRFPLVYFATWHRPTALQSARALRALEPTRLAPGHGRVVDAPGPAMDRAIARAS